MAPIHERELARLAEQERLDKLKTAMERNQWGQFATPPALAMDIAKHMLALSRKRRMQTFRFIDPAVGTGSFFSAAHQVFPRESIATATGIELDPLFAASATKLWCEFGLNVIENDFTTQPPPNEIDRYNLVLTNPPYVRHHHLDASEKQRLGKLVTERLGLRVSGLAGLYCYFMLLADSWLSDGALCAWLIPSEFMDVNYGTTVKQYLLDHVKLIQIHRFCPSDVQFTDALVSSAIVVFEKAKARKDHCVQFTFGGSLNKPNLESKVNISDLRQLAKWTSLPQQTPLSKLPSDATLADLFEIKRGLATGNNDFFVMERQQAKQLGIPTKFTKPILPSPRFMRETIVEAGKDGFPKLAPQLVVIDCNLPEDEIQEKYPDLWRHLEKGKQEGVHEGYLASHRNPWYSQEDRPPAPFLCTYMGRSKERPFRFIWNKSQATVANVYLALYPRGDLRAALTDSPELGDVVLQALQEITPADFLNHGRVYGGGLHKMEPAELKRLPADHIVKRASAYGLRFTK